MRSIFLGQNMVLISGLQCTGVQAWGVGLKWRMFNSVNVNQLCGLNNQSWLHEFTIWTKQLRAFSHLQPWNHVPIDLKRIRAFRYSLNFFNIRPIISEYVEASLKTRDTNPPRITYLGIGRSAERQVLRVARSLSVSEMSQSREQNFPAWFMGILDLKVGL